MVILYTQRGKYSCFYDVQYILNATINQAQHWKKGTSKHYGIISAKCKLFSHQIIALKSKYLLLHTNVLL